MYDYQIRDCCLKFPFLLHRSNKLIQSIQRAVNILKSFEKNEELGVTEISNLTKLNKSTAFNIIVTLEYLGILEQNSHTGKYKLGMELFRLGTMVDSSVRTIAKPYMEKLVEMYSESVNLVIREGLHVVYVEKIESPYTLRIGTTVGSKLPLYCPAVGKSILSTLSEEELNNVLDKTTFIKFMNNTVCNKEELLARLDSVRKNGFDIDIEEYEDGLVGAAAPIRNRHRRAKYAISVSGPKHRLNENMLKNIGKTLVEITNEISEKIGYL
ncbi:MAG: IclR family transcriptional regulator [Clostridia bacterium]